MHKWIVKNSPLLISVILVMAILAMQSRGGSIQTLSGLAVAGPNNQWLNLQDISVGTPITSGAAAVGNFLYNGASYDIQKGDATNGAFVNVKAMVSPVGSKTPADAYVIPTDGLDQLSFIMGFNGTTYDRIRSIANNADAIAVTTLGILPGASYQYGFNGTTWDRLASGGNAADAEATRSLGLTESDSYLRGFNGTTWDRLRSVANNSDAIAVTTLGNISSAVYNYLFNGSTWDRRRSGVITGQALVDWSSTSSSNITTNVTTAVKGTAGILNRVFVNVVGTTSTAALYNIASAGCTGTPASGYVATLATTAANASMELAHTFTLGICAVTAGAAAADISMLYR
jgi:hypothetical protein